MPAGPARTEMYVTFQHMSPKRSRLSIQGACSVLDHASWQLAGYASTTEGCYVSTLSHIFFSLQR